MKHKEKQKGMRKNWYYRRGDVYLADLDQSLSRVHGSIQGGIRPVIVVSNNAANYFSTLLSIVPVTSELKKTDQPTHYLLKKSRCFPVRSMAEGEQVHTILKTQVIRYLGKVDSVDLTGVEDTIRAHFHLNAEDPLPEGEIFP